MYAIAVDRVTTKVRPNARTSEGPVIAKPGPTSRKIVVPIVGPNPIIVMSRSPRSRRNLTSTSRPCAIGSRQIGSPLLVLGEAADDLQIQALGSAPCEAIPSASAPPERSRDLNHHGEGLNLQGRCPNVERTDRRPEAADGPNPVVAYKSEEHTSELQSPDQL